MLNNQLKDAVADQLEKRGHVQINRANFQKIPMRDIVKKVKAFTHQDRSPGQTMYTYLFRFADIPKVEYERYMPDFKPMKAQVHPRAAEIDAAQPPFMSIAANPQRESRPWIEGRFVI